mgnify:CR=1 FL=1
MGQFVYYGREDFYKKNSCELADLAHLKMGFNLICFFKCIWSLAVVEELVFECDEQFFIFAVTNEGNAFAIYF